MTRNADTIQPGFPELVREKSILLDPELQTSFIDAANQLLDANGKTIIDKTVEGDAKKVWLSAVHPKTQDAMHVSRTSDGSLDVLMGTVIRPEVGRSGWMANYHFLPDGTVNFLGSTDSPVKDRPAELFTAFAERFNEIGGYSSRTGRVRSTAGRIITGRVFKER